MKATPLNKTYLQFRFERYEYHFDEVKQKMMVELHYSLDGEVNFTEKLEFPVDGASFGAARRDALDRAVCALHIMGGISYYKAYLPAEITGLSLNAEQAGFWNKVYQRGLGEFFYRNEIDFRDLIKFPVTEGETVFKAGCKAAGGEADEAMSVDGGGRGLAMESDLVELEATAMGERYEGATPQANPLPKRCLVPIGGGKDSLVTAELLREAGVDFTLFSLRDAGPIAETSAIVGRPRIVVNRQIDPRLFELNEAGALNGHVPITAYISFVTAVCAILYGYKYLVFSLEKSANYGQIIFYGMDINHQYSKSEEFEADFRDYLDKYVFNEIEYFSFLRPLNELKIARIFASLDKFEQFAGHFTSCNSNFKIHQEKGKTLWCGECPKCAFVFLILAPFVPRSQLLEIFGQNPADREDLLPLYEELLGLRNIKPFECVGTPEESKVALYLLSKKEEYANDLLVRTFRERFEGEWAGTDWVAQVEQVLNIQNRAFLPEQFWKILNKYA